MGFFLSIAAAIALTTVASTAQAHGDEKHNDAVYDGHAAALGEPGNPKSVNRTVQVTMTDQMRFSPARIAVKRGETVRFTVKNTGQLKHEMQLGTIEELTEHAKVMLLHPEMEHDDPNGISVPPSKAGNLVWKFTKPGEFEFGCLVPGHFEGGMRGKIVVR
ncbi:MAG: hypothetical protein EXQ87_01825 [Alphaproteobacteria bacterium]|nr:hypothetical protein [Alphaproteobacteria bacterium]